MEEQETKKTCSQDFNRALSMHKKGVGGIFIPAGLFIGMGIGFLTDQLISGLFIGLGAGFALLAITYFIKK